MITDEERDLVVRLQNKETRSAAMFELDAQFKARAIAIAIPYLNSESDAQDVWQLVLMKINRSIETKYVHRLPLFSWICRITINACKDFLQKKKRLRETFEMASKDGAHSYSTLESLASGSRAGYDMAHPLHVFPAMTETRTLSSLRKFRSIVSESMNSLSEKHRTILLMADIDGMTYEQISDVLNIPKGTVMSRLFHAREYFEESLENLGYSRAELFRSLV